jgi:hypothetical protein
MAGNLRDGGNSRPKKQIEYDKYLPARKLDSGHKITEKGGDALARVFAGGFMELETAVRLAG